MENIVVFGAGGHAKVIIDIIEQAGLYRILGCIDSKQPAGSVFCGYEVLGDIDCLPRIPSVNRGIVAIGDNWIRSRVVAAIRDARPDFTFVTAIHPRACIAQRTQLGQGTVVMAGAVINTDAEVGEHCIINTNASLDHDSRLGDYTSLAPGAVIGGTVRIGAFCAVSLGANIIHSVSIGDHSVIGAGSTVLSSIPEYTVAYGTPAKPVRLRLPGERYL